MKGEDLYLVEPLTEEPALPPPFTGGFERVTNTRTQDCWTALYVFIRLASGKQAYVGTWEAPFPTHCCLKFVQWWRTFREDNTYVDNSRN